MTKLSCYRQRKVYVYELKVGNKFYDKTDKRYYTITALSTDEKTVKTLIETNPKNSRRNGIIRKSPYGKVTVQEFKG